MLEDLTTGPKWLKLIQYLPVLSPPFAGLFVVVQSLKTPFPAKISPSNIQPRRGDTGTSSPSEMLEDVGRWHQAPYFVSTSLQPPDPLWPPKPMAIQELSSREHGENIGKRRQRPSTQLLEGETQDRGNCVYSSVRVCIWVIIKW